MANATTGYEPYAGKSAFTIPDFQSDEDWCPSHPNEPGCAAYNAAHPQQQQQAQQQEGSYIQNGRRIFKI
jgi:hypothetical protein